MTDNEKLLVQMFAENIETFEAVRKVFEEALKAESYPNFENSNEEIGARLRANAEGRHKVGQIFKELEALRRDELQEKKFNPAR